MPELGVLECTEELYADACEWLKARQALERQPILHAQCSAVCFRPFWLDPSSSIRLILSAYEVVMKYPPQTVNLLFTRRKPTAPTNRLPFPIPTQPIRIRESRVARVSMVGGQRSGPFRIRPETCKRAKRFHGQTCPA